MFHEKSCTFYGRQIILLNIVLLRSSQTQSVQAVRHKDFGKAKQIKTTQVQVKC